MGKVMFLKKGEVHVAPVTGPVISDLSEGSVVYLNESGSPVEFYVAKHNYEPSLNGEGRTLLVRKKCCSENQVWDAGSVNAYAASDIDNWLNTTYKALLDTKVQEAIASTSFYYTPGNGSTGVSTLARAVFLLSVKELGKTGGNTEGSALPIASNLQIAYQDNYSYGTWQWTRTPDTSVTYSVYYLNPGGAATSNGCSGDYGARPCVTLPSNAKFDPETLLITEV